MRLVLVIRKGLSFAGVGWGVRGATLKSMGRKVRSKLPEKMYVNLHWCCAGQSLVLAASATSSCDVSRSSKISRPTSFVGEQPKNCCRPDCFGAGRRSVVYSDLLKVRPDESTQLALFFARQSNGEIQTRRPSVKFGRSLTAPSPWAAVGLRKNCVLLLV